MIETRLQVEAVERKRHSPQVLYIVAGGRECARWDLAREDRQRLQIQDGTKLIDIWTESQGERVLLAAHLVRYTQSQGIQNRTMWWTSIAGASYCCTRSRPRVARWSN